MKNHNYITETFDKEHRHLGGRIYPSDFNTDYRGASSTTGSFIAARIEADFRWEKKTLDKRRETSTPNTDRAEGE